MLCQKKSNVLLDISDALEYDTDEGSDREEDLNDMDLINEKVPKINHAIQQISQILIISHLLGKKNSFSADLAQKSF